MITKILITGQTGFIGGALSRKIKSNNLFEIHETPKFKEMIFRNHTVNNKNDFKLNTFLNNTECVIHCAGRAHIMNENETSPLKKYFSINVDGTCRLAELSAKAGVKRFIFLSTIGVLGNNTNNRLPFSNIDHPNPVEDYAKSKYEAEKVLLNVSQKYGLEVVILRIPLVYGPGFKGNLSRLFKLINIGIPLPFDLINNLRSFIGIDNLIDLIIKCIDHPNAAGKTFLVSDGNDLSTPHLTKLIAKSMGQRVRLFPVPMFLLRFLALIFGKKKEINQLAGSLRVDSSYTNQILNWRPPYSIEEGIKRIVINK